MQRWLTRVSERYRRGHEKISNKGREIRNLMEEILFPASIPNPPGYVEDPKLSWAEMLQVGDVCMTQLTVQSTCFSPLFFETVRRLRERMKWIFDALYQCVSAAARDYINSFRPQRDENVPTQKTMHSASSAKEHQSSEQQQQSWPIENGNHVAPEVSPHIRSFLSGSASSAKPMLQQIWKNRKNL